MRKNIVIIGLILLVVGIALAVVGAQLVVPQAGINAKPSSEVSLGNNLWRTSEITLTSSTSIVEDQSSASSVYLVKASLISSVTQSNLKTIGVAPSSHTTASSENIFTFAVTSSGSYYLVSNSTSQPSNAISVINAASIIGPALVLLVGGGLAFVGLIILIVGLILRKKMPPNPEEY
ncbi:MAG: hypothetical protein M1496_07970 [Candidatus Thermoplasmatota archaeon]|jgi:hypothetical protein|nr:hypothetical protein [Candidatus Thermoplasmatota archaeon]